MVQYMGVPHKQNVAGARCGPLSGHDMGEQVVFSAYSWLTPGRG